VSVAPFPFDYRTRAPAAPLDGLVEALWYARGTVPYESERIAPTGSTVAAVVLGDAIIETPDDGRGTPFRSERGFLLGPHTGPVVNAPTGETFAVGVVATPVGCQALFGVPPATIRGRVVALEDAWPSARRLRAMLLRANEPEGMLDVLEAHLRDTHDPTVPGIDRCADVVRMLEEDPTRPIVELAAEVGISHGHLDRELTRVVGLTPRALARLLRMRRLLASLDVHGDIRWAERAAELGWYDQAHLVRDFKRHTGATPTAYVAAQRAVLTPVGPGDAAGFVPEIPPRRNQG